MKKSYKVVVAIAAASLLTSVAVAPANAAGTKQKVCVALDTGGINDKSFNELSYAGAKSAKAKGYASSVEYLPAGKSYDENVKKFVDKKCTVIVGVGYALGDAVTASAKANSEIKYIMVDFPSGGANVKGLTYNTDENSFLAGYMAAGYSKTGVVATYGGAPYPTVTIFMDGFARGVKYYNDVKGKSVKVLGWDIAKQTGTFVGNFSDQVKAKELSVAFEAQKADVIFPVGGSLVVGTVENSLVSNKSVALWVDADGHLAAPKYDSVVMLSVLKGLQGSVELAIKSVYDGTFNNSVYVGTLKNKGVGISPLYGKFKSTLISKELQSEVADLQSFIADGIISIK
ncbi:MAG: BMP family ABC transporter substrate-binding protein [Actinobacteria bacterium]|nr:BMP family ABC transporter substrate-binding protein [Actinomycetota bacterium]